MYWDDTVIFGLVTIALMIVFMIGWVGFVVRDHLRKDDRKNH
ncbi:cytochrome c oxidase subunit CcoM [Vreelandella andesensis]|nr:cytochrome c oxidase subunit CcoM [Halomonas andesensis]